MKRSQGWVYSIRPFGKDRVPPVKEDCRKKLPIYLRVHTFSGDEARLSVGYSVPPGPLRVVSRTMYLLPGSRSLPEGGKEERDI